MRLKLEIAGGIVLLVLLGLAAKQWSDKQVEVRVATAVAQHDRETDAKLTEHLKQLADADAQRQKDYETRSAALQKLTPQQIVLKVPEYIHDAKEPLKVLDANSAAVKSGEAKVGDVVVPKSDVQPIAQNVLDGDKCKKDLASCAAKRDDWEQKYAAKKDEAERWQNAAKGGSIVKRVAKDILKIGIGVGVGYAISRR